VRVQAKDVLLWGGGALVAYLIWTKLQDASIPAVGQTQGVATQLLVPAAKSTGGATPINSGGAARSELWAHLVGPVPVELPTPVIPGDNTPEMQ